ncbi:MAG: heavy-metal-associated protein [Pseudarthrobacter sp.]|jgi:copper chaperone|nr:heavy-metal-associated protein [Pseudarthrobacter sp.]
MCGTDTRNELPLTASVQSGCSCCSIETQKPATGEGIESSLDGPTCGHCVQTVETTVASLHGVESATVELVAGGASRLTAAGTANGDAVRDAVRDAGYNFTTTT